jgi:hypothetical protein
VAEGQGAGTDKAVGRASVEWAADVIETAMKRTELYRHGVLSHPLRAIREMADRALKEIHRRNRGRAHRAGVAARPTTVL